MQKEVMSTFSTNVISGHGKDNGDAIRWSANYEPNQWDYSSVQFINNNYTEENYGAFARNLMEEVCAMFNISEPIAQVKLINTIDHLGLGYHFEEEINVMLTGMITRGYTNVVQNDGLHVTSVLFRLLRQHGIMISEGAQIYEASVSQRTRLHQLVNPNDIIDIFRPFMSDESNFKESLSRDVEGLISLYQASHFSFKGESILDAAKSFSTRNLKRFTESKFVEDIAYAMDVPLHWRPKRLVVRRYIDIHDKEADKKSIFLQFAKLDFNMVQSIHQSELTKITNWWMGEGLANKLKFARDRTFESFFVMVLILFQRQFGHIREWVTKVVALMLLLDDVYDIYGSLDELDLFTHTVNRWEIKELENIPNYMKTLFKAINVVVDEMGCDIQKHGGLNILLFLQKAWADLCKAFLIEAKWQNSRNKPTLTVYMNNGWVSSSGPLILTHVLFLLRKVPTKETLDYLGRSTKIIHLASIIFRLGNDLATSTTEQERGDAPTAIQCYMNDTGISDVKAREHISGVISETWKELNKEYMLSSLFLQPFADACVNLARMAICLYQHRDGFGIPTFETKAYIQSLHIKPIDFLGKDLSYPNTPSMISN